MITVHSTLVWLHARSHVSWTPMIKSHLRRMCRLPQRNNKKHYNDGAGEDSLPNYGHFQEKPMMLLWSLFFRNDCPSLTISNGCHT